jgi:hypothetical protein
MKKKKVMFLVHNNATNQVKPMEWRLELQKDDALLEHFVWQHDVDEAFKTMLSHYAERHDFEESPFEESGYDASIIDILYIYAPATSLMGIRQLEIRERRNAESREENEEKESA